MGNLPSLCFYQMSSPRPPTKDIISEFPDEILLHILSYLPSEDILTTLALSTRWQSLAPLLPCSIYLDFEHGFGIVKYGSASPLELDIPLDDLHMNNFNFMVHLQNYYSKLLSILFSLPIFLTVQTIPHSSRITKFHLRYPLLPSNQSMSKLKSLLCDAARFKIEEIKLEFDFDLEKYPYPQLMSLPHVLFNSDSLTSLELTMKFMLLCEYGVYKHHEPEFPIEFPNSIWRLPSLKTLHIEWFENWEQLILPGCPVLEELILQCRKSYKTISIASASIQRLTLECFFLSHCNDLEVNCSNLQSLNISDWRGRGDIQVCDLYSLVEANIDIDCTDYYWESPLRWVEDPPIPEILEGIRHVKSLTLTSSTLEAIQFLLRHKKMTVDKLPIFYNLTHLELELNGGREGVILLVYFLQKSPHLQSLNSHRGYIKYEDTEQYCLKDVVPPPCLRHCLKTFSVSSFEGTTKEEIDFLRYILENAKVLEHFTVYWHKYERMSVEMSMDERMSMEQDLSTLFRSDCLYEFF